MKSKIKLVATFVFLALFVFCTAGHSQTVDSQPADQATISHSFQQMPARYPYVIARGEDRQIILSLPIEQRPNRPLHFYGNVVRRSAYGQSGFSLRPRR